jgi:hypothetical protein
MQKANQRVEIREVGQVNKIDVLLGILIGVVSVWSYYAIEPYINPLPNDYVCQGGMAFESVDYGSNIYLKTKQECIDTRSTAFKSSITEIK